MDLDLYIEADGTVRAVYDDALTDLLDPADTHVRRASHVEPVPGGWTADMRPVGGPVIGQFFPGQVFPFKTRAAALAAEREWLDARLAAGEPTTQGAHGGAQEQ